MASVFGWFHHSCDLATVFSKFGLLFSPLILQDGLFIRIASRDGIEHLIKVFVFEADMSFTLSFKEHENHVGNAVRSLWQKYRYLVIRSGTVSLLARNSGPVLAKM